REGWGEQTRLPRRGARRSTARVLGIGAAGASGSRRSHSITLRLRCENVLSPLSARSIGGFIESLIARSEEGEHRLVDALQPEHQGHRRAGPVTDVEQPWNARAWSGDRSVS